MCKDWCVHFKDTPISYCPLCPSMNGWRMKHKLAIDENFLCHHPDDKHCSKKLKKSPDGLNSHSCHFAKQKNKPLHMIIVAYLSECESALPQYLKSFVDGNDNSINKIKETYIRVTDIPTQSVSTKKTSSMEKETVGDNTDLSHHK